VRLIGGPFKIPDVVGEGMKMALEAYIRLMGLGKGRVKMGLWVGSLWGGGDTLSRGSIIDHRTDG